MLVFTRSVFYNSGDFNLEKREYDYSLFKFKERSAFNQTKVNPVKYESIPYQDTYTSVIQVVQGVVFYRIFVRL